MRKRWKDFSLPSPKVRPPTNPGEEREFVSNPKIVRGFIIILKVSIINWLAAAAAAAAATLVSSAMNTILGIILMLRSHEKPFYLNWTQHSYSCVFITSSETKYSNLYTYTHSFHSLHFQTLKSPQELTISLYNWVTFQESNDAYSRWGPCCWSTTDLSSWSVWIVPLE